MGGMTIMSLATHRPDILAERARAIVLVATAATNLGDQSLGAGQIAGRFIGSPVVSRALQAPGGHLLVRNTFGSGADPSHVRMTAELFSACDGKVRGDWLVSMVSMNLLEGIATIGLPTTVMVGTRDTLTLPSKARQIVATVPGARMVTLQGKGHMLPLEDPEAVVDEILRAAKS
jgi:pimeloyl-ACP methyl ester carboxylesterase